MADLSLPESALRYAALGWGVIPCSGKIPISKHGSSEATNDIQTLKAVWSQYPNANVAVATGYSWPFFVIDLDISGSNNGIEAFEDIRGGRALPDTLQQVTGRGGTHYFFKYPTDGRRIKNSASRIAPGVDVRGDGGYVVVHPSIHPLTKQEYTWDGMLEVEQQPIADAPDWLLNLVCDSSDKREPAMLPATFEEGKRNVALFRVACAWRNTGMGRESIFNGLMAENNAQQNRLPTAEIERIAGSAVRFEPKQLTPAIIRAEIAAMERESTDTSIPVDRGPNPAWSNDMVVGTAGIGKNLLYNADIALSSSPEFHGSFAFNEFTHEATVVKGILGIEPGRAVGENEVMVITSWMQKNFPIDIREDTVGKAIEMVSRRDSSHPIRNYLNGLDWDGENRVDDWLSLFLGVKSTKYTSAVGRRWLISAVARIMRPGCKADCCLVLEGDQGAGKSTALRVLAGDNWYSDTSINFKHKDAYGNIQGVWIYELGELDALNKAEAGDVKRFMSSVSDKFRAPFAKKDERVPRQCVFAATVNPEEYLQDATGNRRFWPVKTGEIGRIHLVDLARHRDQIWAEAVSLYNAGEKWYLDTPDLIEEAKREALVRMQVDPWQETIQQYLKGRDEASISGILSIGIGMDMERIGKADSNRVGSILRQIGWKYTAEWTDGKTVKVWKRT